MNLVLVFVAALAAGHAPQGEHAAIVRSSADDSLQRILVYPSSESAPAPLFVLLHPWSGDNVRYDASAWLAEVRPRDWHVVMPNFRGPNLRPESCASELARQDVLDAVAYVRRTYAVDDTRVYLAGVSGGGHMSMVMAAHAPELWAGVSAWVGISDLTAWHAETKAAGRKYWKDVEAVVGGAPGASAAVDAQLRYRSPLYHVGGAKNVPLDLNTGIHDGHTGSVPIHHTIDAYNVLARAQGDDEVSAEDIATLSAEKPLSTTEKQDTTYGRHLHLRRYAGPSRVTVFEGGHEGIPRAACTWLEKQRKE